MEGWGSLYNTRTIRDASSMLHHKMAPKTLLWSCISCREGVEALELENETTKRVMFDVLISTITARKTDDVKCGDNTLNATSETRPYNNVSGAYMEWIFSLNIQKNLYILQ